MCGIVGKLSLRDPIERTLIERMCEIVEHRGPDSRGIFVDENIGLGVQRLAIIDLETGNQPIFNEDRSLVLVLNGEIYNYRELRDSLSALGHHFGSQSDTEVIVHLYEEYGDRCVDHLRGMFAFALWDVARQRLLLARDRLGKKPLYYAFHDGCLWFASEAKAILQDDVVPRDVDLRAIHAFLQYQYVPHRYCAFAALSKLPPAHLLLFERGRVETRRYWRLSYSEATEFSEDETSELIRDHLLKATQLRLRSDVPIGAFLSGGVDSTAVVAAMAQQSSKRVKTFTVGFPSKQVDERPYAREIAKIFDTEHHELVVEPDILRMLPLLAWHYGEPFADSSAVPSFYLSELTRAHVTVALNGDGGDENFGGYTRYAGNDLAKRLERFPSWMARVLQAGLEWAGTGSSQDSTRARLLRLLRAVQLDAPDRYAMWTACFNARERHALYTPSFRECVVEDEVERVLSDAFRQSDAETLVKRLLDVDVQTYLPDQLLVKMDIASMAHSLEVRSPLLDHVFMEMAATLPVSRKMAATSSKRFLKSAIRPWVGDFYLDRPKQGFAMPIAQWLRQELRDLPATLLLDPQAQSRNMFKPKVVDRLIRDHQHGLADNAQKIWALIQLELWFRSYIDVRPTGPITLSTDTAASAAVHRAILS